MCDGKEQGVRAREREGKRMQSHLKRQTNVILTIIWKYASIYIMQSIAVRYARVHLRTLMQIFDFSSFSSSSSFFQVVMRHTSSLQSLV